MQALAKQSKLRKKKGDTALLLIDVVNDMAFPEADQLLRHALPMARKLRALKARALKRKIPTIYINDNFDEWQSNFQVLVERCARSKGRQIVELLAPTADDFFVLKPKHSAFYCTSLEVLLEHLGVRKLIITGLAANICVLFTANDAYMRGYDVIVPRDCVASNTAEENRSVLNLMKRILKADIRPSTKIRF